MRASPVAGGRTTMTFRSVPAPRGALDTQRGPAQRRAPTETIRRSNPRSPCVLPGGEPSEPALAGGRTTMTFRSLPAPRGALDTQRGPAQRRLRRKRSGGAILGLRAFYLVASPRSPRSRTHGKRSYVRCVLDRRGGRHTP